MIPARGVAREILRNNPDVVMWIAGIFIPAAVFEVWAPDGKMLSHGFARAAKSHPILTYGLLVLTVWHLLDGAFPGLMPERIDIYRGFGIIHPRKLIGKNRDA